MEISPLGELGIAIGDGSETGFRGYPLNTILDINKMYKINVAINRHKRITVKINNKKMLDLYEKDLNYDLSDIAVGTGFSKLRPFHGQISDFNMKYRTYDKVDLNVLLIKDILNKTIICLVVICILFILKQSNSKRNSYVNEK